MRIALKRSALTIVASILAAAIMPPEQMSASTWARQNFVVPDGPGAGKLWSDALTPYITELLEMCSTDSGVNEIAVRKSAQSGFTTLILAAVGYIIATDPCRAMIVQPTTGALSEFNKEKLSIAIEQSPTLKALVKEQTSRAGDGSTALAKRFRGGSLKLAIASSAADLRSSTIKKAFLDEINEYPDDLDGQGDPFGMVEARQESFLMSGEWLRVYVSTPTIKGSSKIDDYFEGGDQRYWNMPCPGCGEKFKFVFDRKHFIFNDTYPHEAHYATPCCGSIIEDHEKVSVMKKGAWVPEASRPGAYPSYHFDALSSPFVPFEKIASRFVGANGDPQKLKTFYNLTLGQAFDMKGDAPDHVRLMERREPDLRRGHIPAQGLIFVGSADVQLNGIYYLFKAYGPDRQSWRVDAGYIDGPTDDPHGGAFVKLEELRMKQWPDAYGGFRTVDAFGIDSGYRSHIVYTWVRGKAATFALDGRDGWSTPAMGVGKPVEINFNGQRIRNGTMVWGVGTWSIKGAFYANLHKIGRAGGADFDPPGYCHFGSWLDEVYFRQITAEYLGTVKVKGRAVRRWVPRAGEANHFLDCEVYGDALADYLGVSRMTVEEWTLLASMRGVPESVVNPDMFAPAPLVASSHVAAMRARHADEAEASDEEPEEQGRPAALISEHHRDRDYEDDY
ncbi:phage terminase large subunit family protein [Rhizobium tumorigenes]|uniref:phage terminase large subunit family protein n=1 Tax=Rhizobium tumorigenes TaxID=2041385 RepID=UPI00241EA76F|nr:terminase gpA endonuclease subunit [Rhizobium tumorigenes]WFS01603.1 phage terminase large subunit family protein [Rhizobium tumorigenes]